MYQVQLALLDSRFRADTVIAKEPEHSELNEVHDCGNPTFRSLRGAERRGNLLLNEITALRS